MPMRMSVVPSATDARMSRRLGARDRTGEQADADVRAFQGRRDRRVVLLGEQFGERHERRLLVVRRRERTAWAPTVLPDRRRPG